MVLQMLFLRIVGFPIWWYGPGLALFLKRLLQTAGSLAESLALKVWMKNLFVPMYGDTSFAGRAISFGIRLVMIISRTVGLFLYAILLMVLFVLYLVLPPIAVLGFFYHALGSL
ncbi:hypothetical protein HZA85_03830 [Candidatus Uhrbacteria bacterium]|nr:hypothetical protein [Candidatus Uhrbacteria bacterium]